MRLDCCSRPRDALEEALQAEGIDARAFHSRVTYQYAWCDSAPHQAPCLNAEGLVATNLALPVYWRMDGANAQRVARALITALEA